MFIGLFDRDFDDGVELERGDFRIEIHCLRGSNPYPVEVHIVENKNDKISLLKMDYPVVGYGSSRLSMQASASKNEQKEKSSRSYSLFKPDGVLLNIENELKGWNYRSYHREIKSDTAESLKQRFEGVKSVFLQLLPILSDIQIDPEDDTFRYLEKDEDGNQLPEVRTFDELASGNKSIIAMIGDMIIRLFRLQPKVNKPSDLEGVVIIDELDLHLHPD